MKTLGVMHMLLVRDMDRAIHFYQDAFGFSLLQKSPFWTNMDCGNGKIALCALGGQPDVKETTLIIEVDDHLLAAENISKNGGRVISIAKPYEGAPVYNVVFTDSENNQLTASQTV